MRIRQRGRRRGVRLGVERRYVYLYFCLMRFDIVISCRSTIHHHGEESLCILLSEMISLFVLLGFASCDIPSAKEIQKLSPQTWPSIFVQARKLQTDVVQWGAAFGVGAGIAYAFSPLYRGLTVQFKT
jgi:hypothetical protein